MGQKSNVRRHDASASNVSELDELSRQTTGWCFMPSANLVIGDVMLAQKVALKTCDTAAFAIANRLPPRELPGRQNSAAD